MWTREELKNNAKRFLKFSLFKAVVVCLIFAIFVNILNGNSILDNSKNAVNRNISSIDENNSRYVENYDEKFKSPENNTTFDLNLNGNNLNVYNLIEKYLPKSLADNFLFTGKLSIVISNTIFWFILIMIFILRIFIINPLRIGRARFFLNGYSGDVKISYLFSSFKDGSWIKISLKLFVRDLYIVLWSLLLFIPGIVKSYQYYFVDYILAEDPNLSISDAISLSSSMTSGEKYDIFILDLSFIGWQILASLLLNLGYILLNPYMQATVASLYIFDRDKLKNVEIENLNIN